MGARGPCPTPARGPCLPGVIRTQPSAATDGSRLWPLPSTSSCATSTSARHCRAAGKLPRPPSPRCHRTSCRSAAADDAALPLHCQARRRCRAAATTTAAALLPHRRRCRRCRAAAATATAAALTPLLPLHFCLRCRQAAVAAAVAFIFIVLLAATAATSALLPTPPRYR